MMDRNPLGQSQDPQRLVSNVTPVGITPMQYGVNTTLATAMAKAGQVLQAGVGVGTQIANNKTKEYEDLLKDQGVAIALAKKDILLPQLDDTANAIDEATRQQKDLNTKINKNSGLNGTEIKPWNQQDSIQKYKDIESLKQVDSSLKGLTDKQEKLRLANEYVPKGNAAARAYYDTKVVSDLGNASLNLQAAIDANPMMTPAQIESLTQSIRGRYTKEYLQSGATDAAVYFSQGFDKVANQIKETSFRQAVMQVQDNAGIASRLQTLQIQDATTNPNTPKIVTPLTPGGQVVTAVSPVNGEMTITGKFNENRPGHKHHGVDIAKPAGSPVKTAVSGTVTKVAYEPGYGNYVAVKNVDGKMTLYAHLESSNVKVGDKLGKGTLLGKVGSTGRSTGPHLHFEVSDSNGNRIDPVAYINNLNIPPASKATAMIATGNATVSTAKTATPNNQQMLRNTGTVNGIAQQFQIYGAAKGQKKAEELIDEIFKQTIDKGIPAERAYDILNQFIKTAEEKVIKEKGEDPTSILALRQLQQYKSDGVMRKLSSYEVARVNQVTNLREADTTQNRNIDANWFNSYKELVSTGTDPGTAAAMTSQQFGNPSKNVMQWVSLHNTANNQAASQQRQQQKESEQKSTKASEDATKLKEAQQRTRNTTAKQNINSITGGAFESLGIERPTGAQLILIKTKAKELVDSKNYDSGTALKKAAKEVGLPTLSTKTSPTTKPSGGGPKPTSRTSAMGAALGNR